MSEPSLAQRSFRYLTLADKPAVQALTANTWGDGSEDYVVEVFEDWVKDPACHFVAALSAGQVVGVANIRDLGNGEFWLEGLRIDPGFRDQGIGWALHHYNLQMAQALGARVLRYATGSENAISQKFALRSGFHPAGLHRRYTNQPKPGRFFAEKLDGSALQALLPLLSQNVIREKQGLYQYDWSWQILTPERLLVHLSRGEVFAHPGGGAAASWAICASLEPEKFEIYHLDGASPAVQAELLQALSAYAEEQRLITNPPEFKVQIRIPDGLSQTDLLLASGFVPAEHALWVFEKIFTAPGT